MPRPELEQITFTVDGREVEAPAGMMLADAAKFGDVDIPVFCYEPKLGQPVGACRMCLVEVEGIPKLQTACSTPVRDGMVVNTESDRVKAAQESVVEFLLLNHPLDCPVCDKGGECPLQDISFGWGRGETRFVEPKRHFQKPVELSPLVAIDRERCILCYRCVRFSQEVSEDYQLILNERGADTFVGTFDGHPYVAPFSGNIIELCPVGALTSQAYRFRARPWDIEQSGSVCNLCPGQCNVSYTVRDDRVVRVLSRQNDAVDDGWLCDRGRFAYQSNYVDARVTQPLLRDGDELVPVSWDRALAEAARVLGNASGRVGAIAGGATSNEEGWLLRRLMTEVLDSRDLDSRQAGRLSPGIQAALDAPEAQATVTDLEWAHAVLVLDTEPIDDMPVLDLRLRKGVRRNGVRLAVATSRPSSLDSNAEISVRFAPGAGEAFVCALDAAIGGVGDVGGLSRAAGADQQQVEALGRMLREAGEDVVVVWGERLTHGQSSTADAGTGDNAARALLKASGRLGLLDGRVGAGLLQVPAGANGRGLREIGVLPNVGPGFSEPARVGRSSREIAQAAIAGELSVLHLVHADPVSSFADRGLWDAALRRAGAVVAHASFLTEGVRDHATVVFPAEAGAEKEGTITHPDGRLQRLRPAVGRPADTQPTWQVLAQLITALGGRSTALTSMMVTSELAEAVPFYAGITHDEIGGFGIRWQDREAAASFPAGDSGPFSLEAPVAAASPNGALRLGSFRSVWASPEVVNAPALKFLAPKQRAELNPEDAQERGIRHGQRVRVQAGGDGTTVEAIAHLRAAAPRGSVFLETGLGSQSASALTDPEAPGASLVTVELVGA